MNFYCFTVIYQRWTGRGVTPPRRRGGAETWRGGAVTVRCKISRFPRPLTILNFLTFFSWIFVFLSRNFIFMYKVAYNNNKAICTPQFTHTCPQPITIQKLNNQCAVRTEVSMFYTSVIVIPLMLFTSLECMIPSNCFACFGSRQPTPQASCYSYFAYNIMWELFPWPIGVIGAADNLSR